LLLIYKAVKFNCERMEVLDLLTGRKKRNKAHLKNLIEVAMSDGQLDNIEIDFILALAKRFNISPAEVKRLKENTSSVQYDPPSSDRERFDQIHQLVRIMLIDGEIHERELQICKVLATRMGLRTDFVEDFVKVISDEVAHDVPSDVIIAKLLKMAQERKDN
jgi:uncharacterized tellurite resistance protein B-like protein